LPLTTIACSTAPIASCVSAMAGYPTHP